MKKPPFFIVGCGRSGTTLLQTLIDAHPRLSIPPESLIYFRYGKTDKYYGDLDRKENRELFIKDLIEDYYIRQWNVDFSVRMVEREVEESSRRGVIEAFFKIYMKKHGGSRWGDKSPQHIRRLALIREDFPNSKLIHLIRDGRDVAESFRRFMFGPSSALNIGKKWKFEVGEWEKHKEIFGGKNMIEIKYENLVSNTRRVLKKVFDFIGEDFVDTTPVYRETSLSSSYSEKGWHSSFEDSIDTKKIGLFRKELSEREIELFEYEAREYLKSYGYSVLNQKINEPKKFEKVKSKVRDYCLRWYRKVTSPYVVLGDIRFKIKKIMRKIS